MSYPNASLSLLCGLFGKSRQAFYQAQSRVCNQQVRANLVLARVREIRQHSHKMGTLKLHHILSQELGSSLKGLGRDAFFKLLRDHKLLIKPRKRYVQTTQSNHRFKKWPDLVQRRQPKRPEALWVSDITYVRIQSRWLYLCLVTDAFSRKIMGYKLTHHPTTAACCAALKMAIDNRMYPDQPLMHHSDRGIQYCSQGYIALLQANGINISMTQSGSPYDNALAERVNGILKQEYNMSATFADYRQALKKLVKGVYVYNHLRPHHALDLHIPAAIHANPKLMNKSQELTTLNSKIKNSDNHM